MEEFPVAFTGTLDLGVPSRETPEIHPKVHLNLISADLMVDSLGDAIELGDLDQTRRILDTIPVERLNETNSDKLLIYGIQAAWLISPKPKETVALILRRWWESDVAVHLVSTPVYLTMLPTPTWFQDLRTESEIFMGTEPFDIIIKAIAESLEGWNYYFFAKSLIYQDSSPLVEMAFYRLDRIYGLQDKDVYLSLKKDLEQQRIEEGDYNHIAQKHVDELLDQVGDYAPIPDYIGNFYGTLEDPYSLPKEGEVILESASNLLKQLPDAEKAATIILGDITSGFETLGADQVRVAREARQAFISTYNSSSAEEKLRLLQIDPKLIKRELYVLKVTEILETDPDVVAELEVDDFIDALHLDPTTLEFENTEIMNALGFEDVDAFRQFLIQEYGEEDVEPVATDFLNFLDLDVEKVTFDTLEKAKKFGLDVLALQELENDRILFNFLGPANPMFGPLDLESPCCTYGGCRMFTCIDLENEDEFGIVDEIAPHETIEWFTGNCEYCHQKIEKKIYAVRRPYPFGGWKGTYCSFTCLRKDVPFQDIITHFIINRVESEMKKFKIQDRNFEGKPTTEEIRELVEEDAKEEAYGDSVKIESESIPKTIETEYIL